jgi:hypothetical protein
MPGSIRPFWHVLAVLTANLLWLTASASSTSSETISVTMTPPLAQPAGPLAGSDARTAAGVSTPPLLSDATLTTCDRSAVSAPADYVLACADGGLRLDALHWSAWNTPTATASGTLWQNNCTPDCADGHFIPYSASVTVAGLASDRYTRMHVDAPQAPDGPFDYTIGPNGPQ